MVSKIMIIRFLLSISIALISLDSNGQERDSLKFRETLYDFDKIIAGKAINHRFEIVNEFQYAVEITFIEKSCNCTEVLIEKAILAPGETSYINLILETEGKEGKVYAYALLSANTKQRYYKVGIKGEIISKE
jgi:hypothetical protein